MSQRQVELDDLARAITRALARARFEVGGHAGNDLTGSRERRSARRTCLVAEAKGYDRRMLWTILIILAIIALVLFILGRRAV
jgi:hypothetical protein